MRAYYRCNKIAFFEVLVTLETTMLAQVVLTLRSVFFGGGDFVIMTAE